ncbi:MAG TPA: hypothetical protein VHP83_24160 [Aggregatilineaceae bacterium]|nr:hypothetical protein [Aggregatilineaceae bacterium]
MAASIRAIDLTGIHLRWFDRWLKGIENGINHEGTVTLFVMGISCTCSSLGGGDIFWYS